MKKFGIIIKKKTILLSFILGIILIGAGVLFIFNRDSNKNPEAITEIVVVEKDYGKVPTRDKIIHSLPVISTKAVQDKVFFSINTTGGYEYRIINKELFLEALTKNFKEEEIKEMDSRDFVNNIEDTTDYSIIQIEITFENSGTKIYTFDTESLLNDSNKNEDLKVILDFYDLMNDTLKENSSEQYYTESIKLYTFPIEAGQEDRQYTEFPVDYEVGEEENIEVISDEENTLQKYLRENWFAKDKNNNTFVAYFNPIIE